MSKIILIETSTALCSTALAVDGRIAEYRESTQPRAHAAMTAVFVKEMLDAQGLRAADCDAVCVSAGPGSYTGLRVGSSTAKGLCFAAGIPLLAAGTLEVLAWQAVQDGLVPEGCRYIIPMIDARRMEVYTATFTPDCTMVNTTKALVLAPDSFREELKNSKVLFTGNGAEKYKEEIPQELRGNALFAPQMPHASGLRLRAVEMLQKKEFEDCAYFEPFYLKDFVAGKPKKLL